MKRSFLAFAVIPVLILSYGTTLATPTPVGCTYTMGYWKNHPDAWPVDSLILGDETYTPEELFALLEAKSKHDANIKLAHELIAAKLNVANGADDSAIAATITAADDWLDDYSGKLPYRVRPRSREGKKPSALAKTLGHYNEGEIGPGKCPKKL